MTEINSLKSFRFINIYNDLYSFWHIIFKFFVTIDVLPPIEWTEKINILLGFYGIYLVSYVVSFTYCKVEFISK